MHEQLIRLAADALGVDPQRREPVVGRWYAGMIENETDDDFPPYMAGELMRYDGDGQWSSDDPESESDPTPGDYDYLQEQAH